MSSTDASETEKSISKSNEKKLSKKFLLLKSWGNHSTQASMPIVQGQTNVDNQGNKTPESAWGCLRCLFCCFMSCYLVCPPIPSAVTTKLAFNPPMRGQTYELNYVSGHGQIVQVDSAKKAFGNVGIKVVPKGRHIGRKLRSIGNTETFIVKTGSNNHLVCLKFHPIFAESRDLIVIFAQPNACDIGELFGFNGFCETLRTDLCIFDYSGYGLSTGTPSEENLYKDIQAVFDHVCAANQAIKVILVGMSIGTAACVDLASKNSDRLAGVVLVAPFTSGCRLLRGEPGLQKSPSFDRFRNVDKIGYVEAPILLIHGLDDVIIPAEHSKVLYRKLKRAVPPMFVPKATHNDILENFPDVHRRIRWFIEQEV